MSTEFPTNDWRDDLSVYSDLHKDVYGFRPRGITINSEAQLRAEFAFLNARLAVVEEEERQARLSAQKALKAHLRKLSADHGVDILTALRWDYEARDSWDWEGYCWDAGIGFALQRWLDRREIKSPTYLARLQEAREDMSWDHC